MNQSTASAGLSSPLGGQMTSSAEPAELIRKAAMLDAVNYAATAILTTGDWRQGIQELLGRLGVAADVSRVVLFERHGQSGAPRQSCKYDWAEKGLARLSGDPRYQNISIPWYDRRMKGEVVQILRSDLTGSVRKIFQEHGTLSMVSVPIHVDGDLWGCLCFDDCRTERAWSSTEVDVLVSAGRLIGAAIGRARAEEDLAAAESHASAVLDAAFDGIVTIDSDGCILEFNRAASDIFGYRREDAVGRRLADLIIPEHLRKAHRDGLVRYLKSRESRLIGRLLEVEGLHADGHLIPIEMSIAEVTLPTGSRFTAILRDISERRRIAAELEGQRESLHRAEKFSTLGQLFADIAHELNNPMAIATGYAAMLADAHLPLRARKHAQEVKHATDRCSRIIKSFLAIARSQPHESQLFDMDNLIDEVLQLIEGCLKATQVSVQRKRSRSPLPVWGDRDQLHQVLLNLLINARQELSETSDERTVTITSKRAGGRILITVADTGRGMTDDIKARVFDPFFTTKPKGQGTGLGLALSRRVVEAHGGQLSVDSKPGKGSTFRISLPIGRQKDTGRAVPPPEDRQLAARILVVDDEASIARLMLENLGRSGFKVTMADTGRAALDLLARKPFNLIITDLKMPAMNGAAFITKVKEQFPELSRKIVVVTGDSLRCSAVQAILPTAPVVDKPIDFHQLQEVIRTVIGQSG